ncbi:MAG: hypothetical protein OCD01_03010 [Fibrobacterales bacterium]
MKYSALRVVLVVLVTLLFIGCFESGSSTAPTNEPAESLSDSLFLAIKDSILSEISQSKNDSDDQRQLYADLYEDFHEIESERIEAEYDSLAKVFADSLTIAQADAQQRVLDSLRETQVLLLDSLIEAQAKAYDSLSQVHQEDVDSARVVAYDSLYANIYTELHTASGSNYLGIAVYTQQTIINPTLYPYYEEVFTGYELFQSLATVKIENRNSQESYRVLVEVEIPGYTEMASETVVVGKLSTIDVSLLPNLKYEAIAEILEQIDVQVSVRIFLVKNDRTILIHSESNGSSIAPANTWSSQRVFDYDNDSTTAYDVVDYEEYIVRWAQHNEPSLEALSKEAIAYTLDASFVGYQEVLGATKESVVESQVEALYKALQDRDIRYINSTFSTTGRQKVLFPGETLASGGANCIDGTVLWAALLKHISLNPVIVLLPSHSLVGWTNWPSEQGMTFLETTLNWDESDVPFATAVFYGDSLYNAWKDSDSISVIDVIESAIPSFPIAVK